jgi:hypothetical protein
LDVRLLDDAFNFMTPKEASKLTYDFKEGRTNDLQEFLRKASPREIQEFIHGIAAHAGSSYFNWARVALDIGLAEDTAKTAAKLERFTRWLVALTFALLLLTAFLCYDAYAYHKSIDFTHQSTNK